MKKLIIDTASRDEVIIALEINGKSLISKSKRIKSSQAVLPLIIKVLKENDLVFKDIDEIQVNEGPGSFTGIRVGVSIANALGFVLKIPINCKKEKLVKPKYI